MPDRKNSTAMLAVALLMGTAAVALIMLRNTRVQKDADDDSAALAQRFSRNAEESATTPPPRSLSPSTSRSISPVRRNLTTTSTLSPQTASLLSPPRSVQQRRQPSPPLPPPPPSSQLQQQVSPEQLSAALDRVVMVEDVTDEEEQGDENEGEQTVAAVEIVLGGTGNEGAEEKEEETETHLETATEEQLKKVFDKAVSRAKVLFKKNNFDAAAEEYSAALNLIDRIADYSDRRAALLNNRSAMYEKMGKRAQCLSDCSRCLALEPGHSRARLRKARVYEALDKPEEALSELFCQMLMEREVMKKNAASGHLVQAPAPPERLEPVMMAVVEKELTAIERAKKARKGPALLPSKTQILDCLRNFESFLELEEELKGKGASVEAANEEVESARASGETAGLFLALLNRGLLFTVVRQYHSAIEDFNAAFQLIKFSGGGGGGGGGDDEGGDGDSGGGRPHVEGVDNVDVAKLISWYGVFLHLRAELEEAHEAYKWACELDPDCPEHWLKCAGVLVDSERTEEAEQAFDKAIKVDPNYSCSYMLRADLNMQSMERAAAANDFVAKEDHRMKLVSDLDKCLSLNPRNSTAIIRRCQFYLSNEDFEKADSLLNKAIADQPKNAPLLLQMSDTLNVQAQMMMTMAEQRRSQAMANRCKELFMKAIVFADRAIAADPLMAVAYMNKANMMANMMVDGSEEEFRRIVSMLEKGVELDPEYPPSVAHLANLKINLAETFEDAWTAVNLLDRAIEHTKEKADYQEMVQMKVVSEYRLKAAQNLGLLTARM